VDELEDLLRRYRPAGPPPEFREQLTTAVLRARETDPGRPRRTDVGRPFQGRRTVREWLLPAAAAAAAIIFYTLTASVQRQLIEAYDEQGGVRETAIAELTADLGGDDAARLQAEQVIAAIEAVRLANAEMALDIQGQDVPRE
jgi:hypothetical protein